MPCRVSTLHCCLQPVHVGLPVEGSLLLWETYRSQYSNIIKPHMNSCTITSRLSTQLEPAQFVRT